MPKHFYHRCGESAAKFFKVGPNGYRLTRVVCGGVGDCAVIGGQTERVVGLSCRMVIWLSGVSESIWVGEEDEA